MKKLIFSAAVLASAFFAASCQQEMLDPQAEGTTVTYTVEVPDAIATKATGDGFTLHYEVYRQGDLINPAAKPIYEGTKVFSGGKADVQLEFVKDQEFKVLFWAQQTTGAQAYNITDLRKVSLKTLVANDLTAEVFAGNDHVVDCKSDKNGNVVLVRPVAQLNIATTAAGLTLGTSNSATSSTVEVNPQRSKVVVNGLYGTYNVADGTVDAKAERTYTEADVPGSDFKNTYKLMATNYLGFIPQAGDNVEVKFTIYTEKDGNIEHTVSNVPVKANYQTNILGNLISATADYQVTLEDWADAGKDMEVLADGIVKNINGDYEISTAVGFAYAINKLFADGGTFYIHPGTYDFTGLVVVPQPTKPGVILNVKANEKPVVTRSTTGFEIIGLDVAYLVSEVTNGSQAIFSNLVLPEDTKLVGTNNGVVGVSGCSNEDTNVPAELIGVNGQNGKVVNTVSMASVKDINDAIAQDLKLIELTGDITGLTEIFTISKSVTIDGCGHKLTSTAGRAINVSGADGVTIKNLVIECTGERAINVINKATNVTIDNVTATAANYTVNVALSAPDAFVKIENCTLNGLNTVNVASPGAKVSVDNSTINCNDNNTTDGESYAALCLNKAAVGAEIIATNTVVNVTDGSDSSKGRNGAEDGTVTINGSTEGVTITVAVITYPNSDNYYGFVSLEGAFEFAKEGDVISLIRDLNVAESIIVEEGKNVTLNLNEKTITGPDAARDSEGNRIHVLINNGILSIQNGTINSIAINGGSAILNKGTLTLNNVNVNGAPTDTATGTASYAVNTEGAGSKLTVNNSNISGRGAIGATEGTKVELNGGTYHTPAVAWGHAVYATNEGTEVVINDGIFSEGYEMAANNWGMYQIYSGDKAKVTVKGGTFMPWDCANGYDLHTATDGTIEIYGGTFAENPSSQNKKNYVAYGYKVVENADGTYTVQKMNPVAEADGVPYESLQEAFNVGGNITLLCDVTVDETVVLADAKTAILDLNGKTLSHANEEASYVINNRGTLTITGNGTVNARGIYNGYDADQNYVVDAKLTIENGTFNPKGTNGGAAIFNYGSVLINGGKFTTSGAYSLNNQAGSEMTINYAIVEGGIYNEGKLLTIKDGNIQTTRAGYSHVIYHNGTELVIEGGSFMGNGNEVINANSSIATINGGTFTKDPNGKTSYLMAGAKMTINAGIFNAHTSNPAGHPVRPDVIVKGGTFNYKHTNLAEGYEIVDNDNGTWTVVKVQPNNEI